MDCYRPIYHNPLERIRKCLFCKKIGRLPHYPDINSHSNQTPVLRCIGSTYNCCNKNIWAHTTEQPNKSHKFDCESEVENMWNIAHQKGLCVVCQKRTYYNDVEKIGIGLFVLGSVFAIGKFVSPASTEWWKCLGWGVVVSGTVLFSAAFIVGGHLFLTYRNSDIVDENDN